MIVFTKTEKDVNYCNQILQKIIFFCYWMKYFLMSEWVFFRVMWSFYNDVRIHIYEKCSLFFSVAIFFSLIEFISIFNAFFVCSYNRKWCEFCIRFSRLPNILSSWKDDFGCLFKVIFFLHLYLPRFYSLKSDIKKGR